MIIFSEMLEAVGHEFMEEFFTCCESALAEDGFLVLQVMNTHSTLFMFSLQFPSLFFSRTLAFLGSFQYQRRGMTFKGHLTNDTNAVSST